MNIMLARAIRTAVLCACATAWGCSRCALSSDGQSVCGDVTTSDASPDDVIGDIQFLDVPPGCGALGRAVALPAPAQTSCGPSCTWLVERDSNLGQQSLEFDGELYLGTNAFLYVASRTHRTSLWENSRPQPFCAQALGYTNWEISAQGYSAICLIERAGLLLLDLVTYNRQTGVACKLVRFPAGTENLNVGPRGLVHLRGAYAWYETFDGRNRVQIYDEGAPAPRSLLPDDLRSTYVTTGGDDTLVIVNGNVRNRHTELWVSHPPFRDAIRVLDSVTPFGELQSDPENPSHVVYTDIAGDALCGAGADIRYLDLSANPPTPIAITRDDITQGVPTIRGDRVGWLDLRNDTLTPRGCIEDAHNAYSLMVGSVQNPAGAREVWRSDTAFSPVHMGVRDVYFTQFGRTGVVSLP